MKKIADNRYQYSAVVHNTAKKGKIYRVSYYYRIGKQDSKSNAQKRKEENTSAGESTLGGHISIVSEEDERYESSEGKTVVLTMHYIRNVRKRG